MEMNGKTVDISIDYSSSNGTFTSSDLMLLCEPISNLKCDNRNISFSIMLDVEMMFEGTVDNEKINGKVSIQGGPPNMKISFNLSSRRGLSKNCKGIFLFIIFEIAQSILLKTILVRGNFLEHLIR